MQNHLTTSQRRALWALSLAYFIQATGSLSVAGSQGSISQEWGISDAQSARLLSIFGLTFALGAPLAQVLFGKLMRRTQVLAGMLVFGLGAFIFAIAPDYKVLVASRIVMGLGASLIGPVLVALFWSRSALSWSRRKSVAVPLPLFCSGCRWPAWSVFRLRHG